MTLGKMMALEMMARTITSKIGPKIGRKILLQRNTSILKKLAAQDTSQYHGCITNNRLRT